MAGVQRVWRINSAWLEVRVLALRNELSPEKFKHIMASSFKDTGRHFGKLMKDELSKTYAPPKNWIGSAVGNYRMSNSGMSCTIPISGVRGLHGPQFKVSGARGRPKKGGKVVIRSRILKAGASQLPDKMAHQGGNPPFRAKGLVFTRTTDRAKPIARVPGIGVPQMPISQRARAGVERAIMKYLGDRIEHNFERLG